MTSNRMVEQLRRWAAAAKGKDVVHLEGISKREFLDTTQAIVGRLMIGVINREYTCPCCGCKSVVVGMTDLKDMEEDDE